MLPRKKINHLLRSAWRRSKKASAAKESLHDGRPGNVYGGERCGEEIPELATSPWKWRTGNQKGKKSRGGEASQRAPVEKTNFFDGGGEKDSKTIRIDGGGGAQALQPDPMREPTLKGTTTGEPAQPRGPARAKGEKMESSSSSQVKLSEHGFERNRSQFTRDPNRGLQSKLKKLNNHRQPPGKSLELSARRKRGTTRPYLSVRAVSLSVVKS